MRREDVFGLIGGPLLLGVAYLDMEWRWFWAFAGIGIFLWSVYTALFVRDGSP